jgi:hypothetical protein
LPIEKFDRISAGLIAAIQKNEKPAENPLTKGGGFGILSKLFARTRAEKEVGKRKKVLTRGPEFRIIAMFREKRRVPCKLNNVTKRKHQTEWVL